MYKMIATVTTGAGTTAAVNASSNKTPLVTGKLHSVYFDIGSITSVTNVTIATDVSTIFTVSSIAADGWYHPRRVGHSAGGTAQPGTAGLFMNAINSWLRVSVSSSTPNTLALTAHLFIEEG